MTQLCYSRDRDSIRNSAPLTRELKCKCTDPPPPPLSRLPGMPEIHPTVRYVVEPDIGRPIAVIVVVSLLIITAIILIAVWYYRRNKKRKKKSETQTEMENRENVDPKPKEVTENYAVTDNQENDNYYCRVSTENMAECENVGYLIPYSDYGIREEKQQLGTEITEIEKEKEENAHALTGRQNSRTPILSQSTGQE